MDDWYGCQPTLTYLETPVIVDDVSNETVSDRQEHRASPPNRLVLLNASIRFGSDCDGGHWSRVLTSAVVAPCPPTRSVTGDGPPRTNAHAAQGEAAAASRCAMSRPLPVRE